MMSFAVQIFNCFAFKHLCCPSLKSNFLVALSFPLNNISWSFLQGRFNSFIYLSLVSSNGISLCTRSSVSMRNHFIFYCNHSYLAFFVSFFPSPSFHPLHLLLNPLILLVIHTDNLVGVLLFIFYTHRIHTHIHVHAHTQSHTYMYI